MSWTLTNVNNPKCFLHLTEPCYISSKRESWSIGRAESNDLRLDSKYVSRTHAQLSFIPSTSSTSSSPSLCINDLSLTGIFITRKSNIPYSKQKTQKSIVKTCAGNIQFRSAFPNLQFHFFQLLNQVDFPLEDGDFITISHNPGICLKVVYNLPKDKEVSEIISPLPNILHQSKKTFSNNSLSKSAQIIKPFGQSSSFQNTSNLSTLHTGKNLDPVPLAFPSQNVKIFKKIGSISENPLPQQSQSIGDNISHGFRVSQRVPPNLSGWGSPKKRTQTFIPCNKVDLQPIINESVAKYKVIRESKNQSKKSSSRFKRQVMG